MDFKWGWNAENGEATVWRVDGGADGSPLHEWYLTDVWGRGPSVSAGDIVGIAAATNTNHACEDHSVTISAFYGSVVPASVVDWFRVEYPGHSVEAVELPKPESPTGR